MSDKAHPSGPMQWTRGVQYVVPEGYTFIVHQKKQDESAKCHTEDPRRICFVLYPFSFALVIEFTMKGAT